MSVARSRFSDFLNQDLIRHHSPVTIIGVGGIGSPAAETLAGIGFDLVIYDHDSVKPENIGSQRYGFPEIDQKKVTVLKNRLEQSCRIRVEAIDRKYEGQVPLAGITVCGVDSLEERAKIWEQIKYNPAIPIYLDGRVGGERFKLFSLNPCDPTGIEKYETHLDLAASRSSLKCTSKFAPQAGIALNWLISSIIKEWIVGNTIPFQVVGQNLELRKVYL